MHDPATQVPGVLQAPSDWRSVDLISDLHLHPDDPGTLAALTAYLEGPLASQSDALIVLGDLFEVWIGDDVLTTDPVATALSDVDTRAVHFWCACARLLAEHARRRPVWFMAGNRDFLLGAQGLKTMGLQALPDPTRLELLGKRWLLSHGDALCLADTDYMAFRQQVRDPSWQQDFLNRPLAERTALVRQMRQRSQEHQRQLGGPEAWADVDPQAAVQWLRASGCPALIHGHTHRPALHQLEPDLARIVLSDWDLKARPARAEVLRLDANGWHRLPLATVD